MKARFPPLLVPLDERIVPAARSLIDFIAANGDRIEIAPDYLDQETEHRTRHGLYLQS